MERRNLKNLKQRRQRGHNRYIIQFYLCHTLERSSMNVLSLRVYLLPHSTACDMLCEICVYVCTCIVHWEKKRMKIKNKIK